MKTVKIRLSEEAKSDRGLQISELATFLTKNTTNDWQESTDNELVEYDESENGQVESIYWSVSEYVENAEGSFTFELDC
jgi:hypothetical protein